MAIQQVQISVTASGSAGAATGTATQKLTGKILSVHVNYATAAPAGTDVQLEQVSPAKVFLDIDDNNTDGWYNPRVYAQDTAGADLTFDGTNEIPILIDVYDQVKATVAQANNGDVTVFTIQYIP